MFITNFVKVMAAFLAGIVVAIGAALLYVRSTDSARSHPVAVSSPAIHPAPVDASAPAPEDSKPAASSPAPSRPASDQDEPAAAVRPPKAQPKVVHTSTKPRVNQIAKTTPVSQPVAPPQLTQTVEAHSSQPPYVTPANLPPPRVNEPNSGRVPRPAGVSAEGTPPVTAPHSVTLEAGTSLMIRLGETISTSHNYSGDTFRGTLDEPIIRDGFIIAEKGSRVLGHIVNSQDAGRVKGVSDLSLTLSEINTTDGQHISIETSSFNQKGSSGAKGDAAKIGAGAAIGAIIGAIAGGGKGAAIGAGAGGAAGTGAVLVTRGKPAVLEAETRMNFQLTRPVTITEKINN